VVGALNKTLGGLEFSTRHKLATYTASADPADSPRVQAAVRDLMESVKQGVPAELDTLWAELASDILILILILFSSYT